MEIEKLKQHVEKVDKISNDSWLKSLNERKLKELEFHNRDRQEESVNASADTFEKFYANRKYYHTVERSRSYVDNWLKHNVEGKVVLDYACGNGDVAIKTAKYGAKFSLGFDISDVSVQNARNIAKNMGLESKVKFFQADAEDTKLPDNSIDIIICSGMLHHLDLSYTFPELRRILKPGGKVFAIEALDYNPAIKLYRKLTPNMRTEWEKAHILKLSDLTFANRFFEVDEIKYWHVIGYAGALIKPLAKFFDLLDIVLEKIPFINRLSWTFTFVLKKRQNDT